MPRSRASVSRLPHFLERKVYKTGQTRGADDDVIYQNRVSRNSTVLIPYHLWDRVSTPPHGEASFENKFIALISPSDYFSNPDINKKLRVRDLELGRNALVFYRTRTDWETHNPDRLGWSAANSRTSPLNGEYVARIAATTATDRGGKISRGFNTTGIKGAGIRLFEYASKRVIEDCRLQLEALFWLCRDSSQAAIEFGMREEAADTRRRYCLDLAESKGLLSSVSLVNARVIGSDDATIWAVCPLCLEPLSGYGFFNRLAQARGREVPNLTVTEINLFHIQELRYGEYNQRPYNLGWGHHHCNVVVRDSGIDQTLKWMRGVLQRNIDKSYFNP